MVHDSYTIPKVHLQELTLTETKLKETKKSDRTVSLCILILVCLIKI